MSELHKKKDWAGGLIHTAVQLWYSCMICLYLYTAYKIFEINIDIGFAIAPISLLLVIKTIFSICEDIKEVK